MLGSNDTYDWWCVNVVLWLIRHHTLISNEVHQSLYSFNEGGAPTALVSLIGHKQYKRCARDIYYFLQVM